MIWSQFLAWLQQPEVGLVGVAIAAFIAATVLPLASELVLLGYVAWQPSSLWLALLVATVFNTAGGMTTYALGRYGAQALLKRAKATAHSQRWQRWQSRLQRRGAIMTVFAWLPMIGDGIVLAAGVLHLPALACLLWQLLGRGVRYAALLGLLNAWLP
jgi:membrane protein YqaA with SNARE-associated domain